MKFKKHYINDDVICYCSNVYYNGCSGDVL